MKYKTKNIPLIFALVVVTACTHKPGLLKDKVEAEALVDCYAFTESYGRYLTLNFPDPAKQYTAIAKQNSVAAWVIQSTLLPSSVPMSQENLGQALVALDQRLTKWDNYLLKADAASITKQASTCNTTYTPKLSAVTTKMRADPNFAPLYKTFDQFSTIPR